MIKNFKIKSPFEIKINWLDGKEIVYKFKIMMCINKAFNECKVRSGKLSV